MAKLIKLGARGSPLSLTQAGMVARDLTEANPGLTVEIVTIKTTGDKMRHVLLSAIGGKGAFAKEIEDALLAGQIDLAVHSAKDLPSRLPDGLILAATPPREDFRDVLISNQEGGLAALAPGARVGTSGLRRQSQLLALRPDLVIKPIRGNLATRLQKIRGDDYEATILAAAGLNRLKLSPDKACFLEIEAMLPAVGQGVLALEIRTDDQRVLELVQPLDHYPTFLALAAERGYLRHFGSGCQMPVAALAGYESGVITIEGLVATTDGRTVVRRTLNRNVDSPQAATELGDLLASEVLARGGDEIMKELIL